MQNLIKAALKEPAIDIVGVGNESLSRHAGTDFSLSAAVVLCTFVPLGPAAVYINCLLPGPMTAPTEKRHLNEEACLDSGLNSGDPGAAGAQEPEPQDKTLTADAAAFLEVVHSRRSIGPKRLAAPGPTPEQLAEIMAAGLTAPDHCLLRPWRFIRIPDAKRAALAELFAEEKRLTHPGATDAEIEAERARAFNAPVLIAVLIVLTENFPKVPVHEQYISLGAAVQNILLAAHALGFGAIMTSGRKIEAPMLQDAFRETSSERLLGFLSLGTPTRPPKTRLPATLHDHFTDWTG